MNVRQPSFQPVFIIGSHRSGTSILHRLLAASGCFNSVTAFHVINRGRLVKLDAAGSSETERSYLNRLFQQRHMVDEYGNPVFADTLEEYAFALGHTGRKPILNDATRNAFIEFCNEVQAVQDPTRPLLLKSPFDTTRFLYIRSQFAEARFVFVHRNPVQVIDSQIKLIRQMLEARAHYDALLYPWYRRIYDHKLLRIAARAALSDRFPFLLRLVAQNVSRNCDYICTNIDNLGTAAIGVTYDAICADAAAVVKRILNAFELEARAAPEYALMVSPRHNSLLPEVATRRATLERRNRDYCRKFGV